jgi:hypothetical protein
MPKDQISALESYCLPEMSSGAIQHGWKSVWGSCGAAEFAREETNRANERTPLADLGKAWRRLDIGVKDNGPECHGVLVHMSVVLVVQWCGNAEVAKEYGTIIVDEEICCFDITVNKSVDMQVAVELEIGWGIGERDE